MTLPNGFEAGFCFSVLASDEKTKFMVNVCGTQSIGAPLTRGMDPVPESLIDERGVDNIIIPISVSPLVTLKGGGDAQYAVDVIVHTSLTRRCVRTHPLVEHLLHKLTVLAVEWVQQECGVRLQQKSCQLQSMAYYHGLGAEYGASDAFRQAAALMAKHMDSRPVEAEAGTPDLPAQLDLQTARAKPRAPLIQEITPSDGMRKGFLVGSSKSLYGPHGSREGEKTAADPLWHVPESLRRKCRIIDAREAVTGVAHSSSEGTASRKHATTSGATGEPATVSTADWQLTSMENDGTAVTLRLRGPDTATVVKDVDLFATEHAVEINGRLIEMPVAIDLEVVRARIVKVSRTLVVTCPVRTG